MSQTMDFVNRKCTVQRIMQKAESAEKRGPKKQQLAMKEMGPGAVRNKECWRYDVRLAWGDSQVFVHGNSSFCAMIDKEDNRKRRTMSVKRIFAKIE